MIVTNFNVMCLLVQRDAYESKARNQTKDHDRDSKRRDGDDRIQSERSARDSEQRSHRDNEHKSHRDNDHKSHRGRDRERGHDRDRYILST